ncbi:MAG: SAM-dependent methyltransferase, partial [Psychrilyobacter sp.]|nr:SAM-dependent methyltransferase [Psychrilyobacter sp.]
MKINIKYLYEINYPTTEEELCLLEMRTIFNSIPTDKVIFSNKKFDPSNSPFIRRRLDITHIDNSLIELLAQINCDKVAVDNFKVEFLKLYGSTVSYHERLEVLWKIGDNIEGEPSMKSPSIMLGVTKYGDNWYFGVSHKNNGLWRSHKKKPCSYSNSLNIRTAKALVNIASLGETSTKIIDPCCGVGTTLVEGLSMGYDICGYEISQKNASNCKTNLEFFNLETRITHGDMHNITDIYDTSIIDIPYGLFCHVTKEMQQNIIHTARKISKKMILITFENLDSLILNANFKIIDRCIVVSGTFKR